MTTLKSIDCVLGLTLLKYTTLQTPFWRHGKYRHFLWNSRPGAGTRSSRKTFSLVAKKQSTSQKAQDFLHIFNPPAALQLWLGDSASWLTTMERRIPAAAEALCVAASLPPAQKRGLGGGRGWGQHCTIPYTLGSFRLRPLVRAVCMGHYGQPRVPRPSAPWGAASKDYTTRTEWLEALEQAQGRVSGVGKKLGKVRGEHGNGCHEGRTSAVGRGLEWTLGGSKGV